MKLHPTTSDRESSENEAPRSKSNDKVEEFLPIDRNQDKELNRLKALKSELAAKAKESLEKKIISEIATTSSTAPGKSSSNNHDSPPKSIEHGRAREMEIVAQTVAISTKEKQAAIKEREDKKKITIKPFKIDGSSPLKNSGEVAGAAKAPGGKPEDKVDKARKSRSHSRSQRR